MEFFLSHLAASRKLLLAAPLFAGLLLTGCQKGTATSTAAGKASRPEAAQAPTPAPTPEANIYVDEALLARPYAIIGGTVENVGAERLEKLSVEIELRRRADGSLERREVAVEPGELEPGKQGKFKLKVLSEEWAGSRVVSLRSQARPQEVAFKSLPGARRPPEKIEGRPVDAAPARKKSAGDDFINTPDTPYSVP